MKITQKVGLALVVFASTVATAHAALPAAVGTTVTQIQGDATDLFASIFPVIASVMGLVLVVKLFKKFFNKL